MPQAASSNRQDTFTCNACSITYSNSRHLDSHQRHRCSSSKRSLTQLLGQANVLWEARKRQRRSLQTVTASTSIAVEGTSSNLTLELARDVPTSVTREGRTALRRLSSQVRLSNQPPPLFTLKVWQLVPAYTSGSSSA